MLSDFDARSVVRLLGEVAALEGDFSARKRFLMEGLCELIDADSCIWALGCQMEPQKPQVFVNFIHNGFTEQTFADYLKAVEHPDMVQIASKFASTLAERGKHTTMIRDEIDEEGLSYLGEVGQRWRGAGIGSLMLSAYPVDQGSVSMVGLYRHIESEPFTEREKYIADLLLSEVPWLHLSGWPEDRAVVVPKLSPRKRIVLNLLLESLSRKQIAGQLELSEHTVSGYIKEIYRHFGVSSHAELMKKFLQPRL